MAEVKPGKKTTEFWLSAFLALVGPIVTVLVGAGLIDAKDAASVTSTISASTEAIVEAGTIIVSNLISLYSVRQYTKTRGEVKIAAIGKVVPLLLLCLLLTGCGTGVPAVSSQNLIDTNGADHLAYLEADTDRPEIEKETYRERWNAHQRLVNAVNGGSGESP